MRLISLYDSEWKIQRIDNLVRQGLFASRTEVYRYGSFLMTFMPEARRLASLAEFNSRKFKQKLRQAVEAIDERDIQTVIDELQDLGDGFVIKSFIASILLDKRAADFESFKDTMRKSVEVLARIDHFDTEEQDTLLKDLKRDLIELMEMQEAPPPIYEERVLFARTLREEQPYDFGIVKFDLGQIRGHGVVQVEPMYRSERNRPFVQYFAVMWPHGKQFTVPQKIRLGEVS